MCVRCILQGWLIIVLKAVVYFVRVDAALLIESIGCGFFKCLYSYLEDSKSVLAKQLCVRLEDHRFEWILEPCVIWLCLLRVVNVRLN